MHNPGAFSINYKTSIFGALDLNYDNADKYTTIDAAGGIVVSVSPKADTSGSFTVTYTVIIHYLDVDLSSMWI